MTNPSDIAPRVLCIETSGPTGSIALGAGGQLLAETSFAATAGHARNLLPLADRLCREAGWKPRDLNECHVSIGPGSFTGLRVAVTLARHLALACGVRVVAVPTLESIAWNLVDAEPTVRGPIAVFVEARKGMVFAARFEVTTGTLTVLDGPAMVTPSQYLATTPRPSHVTGSGAAQYLQLLKTNGIEIAAEPLWASRARGILALGSRRAQLGFFTEPSSLTPLYVRRPEAEELWEKRQPTAIPDAKSTPPPG